MAGSTMNTALIAAMVSGSLVVSVAMGEEAEDRQRSIGKTTFQIHAPWSPVRDFQADTAIVYGVDETFAARLKSFAEQGYKTEMMTGAAWGNYQDYIDGRFDGVNHMDDAQVRRD